MRLAIGLIGALSVFCGYKLFCEIPFAKNRAIHGIHVLSGSLLALFGMAMLIAGVHGVSNTQTVRSHQSVTHANPAEAGSLTTPRIDRHRAATDWAI